MGPRIRPPEMNFLGPFEQWKKNPGWLGYIGDDIPTQVYRDYNKPL